jgi:hypothetical protein
MCSIITLGAINKETNEYVYPAIANKIDKYICPECNRDVILRKGEIRICHFAHMRDDNPCMYYNKPSESQIHKDAKLILKKILDDKKEITIKRACIGTMNNYNCPDIYYEEHSIPIKDKDSNIVIEYNFEYNGKKCADVAYIYNNEIVCIFEIYNTHRTEEQNRPEPWFELNAIDIINYVNMNNTSYIFECIRKIQCDYCIDATTIVTCARCNEQHCKIVTSKSKLLDTNNRICHMCKYVFEKEQVWLNIPYSDKDTVKKYGARFDNVYKKWFIDKNNKYINIILSKWSEIIIWP